MAIALGCIPTGTMVNSARAALIFDPWGSFCVRTTATSPDWLSATSRKF